MSGPASTRSRLRKPHSKVQTCFTHVYASANAAQADLHAGAATAEVKHAGWLIGLTTTHATAPAAEEAKRRAAAARQELLRAGLEAQRAEAAARKAKEAKDDALWAVELAAQATANRVEQKARRVENLAAMEALKVCTGQDERSAGAHMPLHFGNICHMQEWLLHGFKPVSGGQRCGCGAVNAMCMARRRPSERSSCWNSSTHVMQQLPPACKRTLQRPQQPQPSCNIRWRSAMPT